MQDLLPVLFDGVSPEDVKSALTRFKPLDVPHGQPLIEEGDDDPSLIVILQGSVEVSKGEVDIATVGQGELVGEIALFGGRSRAASVRTLEDCKLLMLDAEGYEALREEDNGVAWAIERSTLVTLGRRLRAVDDQVSLLSDGMPSPYLAPPSPSFMDRVKAFFLGPEEPPAIVHRDLDTIEVLRSSRVFSEAEEDQLVAFAEAMTHGVAPNGHFLCTQGQPGDQVYVLARGRVEIIVAMGTIDGDITQAPVITRLAVLQPGAVFGMTALTDGRPRMASCVARGQVDVLAMHRDRFDAFVQGSDLAASVLRRSFIRALIGQLVDANRLITKLELERRKSVRDDVAPLVEAGARLEHTGQFTRFGVGGHRRG